MSGGEGWGLPPHWENRAPKGLSDPSPARNWSLAKMCVFFSDDSIIVVIIIIIIAIVYRHRST